MSEWKKVKFLDLFSEPTKNGIYKSKEFHGRGAKIINMGEVFAYSFIGNQEMSRVEINDKERNSFLVKNGDLLFARRSLVESGAGKCAIANGITEETTFESSIIRVRLNENNAIPLFYMYWMRSLSGRTAINGIVNGVNVKGIRATDLQNIEVELPPMETQHRIATILSRYDSLIENYQKQIKLLEEAAQRLYKEWFVNLHFPGHENTKIVDGVPDGWEKKPALDFFEMSIGKTPPRAQKQWFTKGSNGIPWVSISDMKDTMFVQETAEELTQDACENYNIKVVPKGTILLSFKLTVGRVAFAGADVCTNEAIAHFQKEGDEWKAYTLMYLRNYNYDSLGNTSGISKAVNSTIIKNMPFVMPCTAILQEFSQRVLPFIKQTENLQSQIRLLTEARDRLLPKLMSGEIKVS
ncbi:restriction endonuclease subunit S [Prevotella sp. E9-3]|uniref:restriction endonuclease subunit S n=1 Tax=Prevotella sp. E9-3 TaxID=2913621 RepID=UPI001EDC4F0D|nr:restriction endonuclease subunit S [Prevotella sp. E9-3]UKK48541.1 restriction endonuclease subunit S [Prevotella sp. E9-3]